ncbi:MAG: hypothetical protein VCC00_06890 [Deltaproteobacteria bacterium]
MKAKRPKGGSRARFQQVAEIVAPISGTLAAGARDSISLIAYGEDDAYFEVYRDASKVRFRAGTDLVEQMASPDRASLNELEARGRQVLGTELRAIVPTTGGDQPVFLGARYMTETETEIQTGVTSSRVVANIAIFGREINGIPVVGPGSKVALFFSGTGALVGFDVDWPPYKVLRKRQATLKIDEVRQRFAEFARAEVPLLQSSSNLNLTRFECGYVDLGHRKRKGQKIQAGCVAQVDGRSADGRFRIAYSEVLPIGARVQRDRNWPSTFEINGRTPKPCKTCAEPYTAGN